MYTDVHFLMMLSVADIMYLRIGVTVNYKPVKAPCSLFYTTRSCRIKAAEYTVSFYLLKFAYRKLVY